MRKYGKNIEIKINNKQKISAIVDILGWHFTYTRQRYRMEGKRVE